MGRMGILPYLVLGLAAGFSASAQSVIATHSGVVYYFEGSVFLENQPLQQRFGKFPDIGTGHELRTEQGRAEVLLTPGVILRIDGNSSVRLVSDQLADTRVELLSGSAILEANGQAPHTAVQVIYKDWQVSVPQDGVYRIDAEPAQIEVYQGEAAVAAGADASPVTVKEGQLLPLSGVLVTEAAPLTGNDEFKTWAMNRSQAISADNSTAADILDDPGQMDAASGMADGGFTYFPPAGMASLGVGNPYGLSFWSPYQSTLTPIYAPLALFGAPIGWPIGFYGYPRRVGFPSGTFVSPREMGGAGVGSGRLGGSSGFGVPGYRPFTPPPRYPLPTVPAYRPPVYHAPVYRMPTPVYRAPAGSPGVSGGGMHVGGRR